MRKQDINLTDIYTTQQWSRESYIVVEIGGWELRRAQGCVRSARSQDHLLLHIDPTMRRVLSDGSEGELVDWFAIAAKVREDIVSMPRIQANYSQSENFYKPAFGSLLVTSSRKITTHAAKDAEADAALALRKAQRERSDSERFTRRDRFEAALTGAGIPLDYDGVPSFDGSASTISLSLAQLEGLLQRANK